jgi:Fic family protein
VKIPLVPPDPLDLMGAIPAVDDLVPIIARSSPVDDKGRYLHWDEMRNRTPPHGLSLDQWWLGTAMSRRTLARRLPLVGVDGKPFSFCNVDQVQELVHEVDRLASGQILADDVVTNLRSSDRYLVSSLVEEAIASSQLEGASTTRQVAKEMLQTGRRPRDRSEQMILNNFHAMQVAQDAAGEPLTEAGILELHRVVTEGTLDDPADAGRLQRPEEDRIAIYWPDGQLLHRPPPASELPGRVRALCSFADGGSGDGFIHPVVRAIVVHFWIGYDHPFADGNGRTARALFYRSMLGSGYWLTRYLTISSILKQAPAKYAKSYLYCEAGENDITYFVIYQLQVIRRAIESLYEYLRRKVAETREIEAMLHGSPHLNHRQLVIVGDALRDPSEPFTVRAQQTRHRVTYESARSDLLGLERLGLFTRRRVGKKHMFSAQADLTDRLRSLGS